MDKLVIGFCGGITDLDKAIKYFSDSETYDITHSFVMILDSTFESRGIKEKSDPYPGVWLHSPEKYANDTTARFIEIEIPSIEKAEASARNLIGSAYGYSSCLAIFLKKVFKIDFPDSNHSCDCSEAQSTIIRNSGVSLYPKLQVNEISPVMVFKWAMKHGGKDVTDRFRK